MQVDIELHFATSNLTALGKICNRRTSLQAEEKFEKKPGNWTNKLTPGRSKQAPWIVKYILGLLRRISQVPINSMLLLEKYNRTSNSECDILAEWHSTKWKPTS